MYHDVHETSKATWRICWCALGPAIFSRQAIPDSYCRGIKRVDLGTDPTNRTGLSEASATRGFAHVGSSWGLIWCTADVTVIAPAIEQRRCLILLLLLKASQ